MVARLGLAVLLTAAGLHAQTPVVRQLRNSGPNANRINVVLLGDGFTVAEQDAFFTAAQQKLDVLVNNESFAPFKDLINGYAIFTASNQSGTDIAAEGTLRDTYYDTGFSGAINSRLLVVATNAGATRAQTVLRSNVPDYDIALMIVNTTVYGGAGGIPTVFSLNTSADEVMLHETGHAFAKLADEYVDAQSAPSYPPAEYANATQKGARADIPWRAFLLDSTPVPTIATSTDANFVGVWEGSHYRATGFFRPIYDSKMRSLGRPFGPIGLRAFADAVHGLNLNGATSAPSGLVLQSASSRASGGGTLSISVIAQGAGPLTYQWSRNGKNIAGQTGSTLTLTNVGAATVGSYSVEVTNAVGSVTSAAGGLPAQVASSGSGSSVTYDVQLGTQSTIRWVATSLYSSEQAGVAILTLARSGTTAGITSVSYSSAAGTAGSPADFTGQSGSVTWADGDSTAKTISIPIIADTLTEGFETFTVSLGSVTGGVLVGDAVATVSIADPGLRDPAFNSDSINNSVYQILPLADGSMLVAGAFSSAQSSFATNYSFGGIARLTATGALDTSFSPGTGANNSVRALARQADGKILIGGSFTAFNGTARNRIARLNADGSLDGTFDPGTGADNTIYDLLVQSDGKVLVAGAFTAINGTAREYLARLNTNGSVDTTFTGPDFGSASGWWVRNLAAQPDGKILVGGVFFFSGATSRASICRISANGSLDSTFSGVVQGPAGFNTAFTGEIKKVALQPDGKILIGGDFSSYNLTGRRGIARLAADGSLDATFNPGTGTDATLEAVSLQADGKVIIGGAFTTVNGVAASRLARLNADGSLDSSYSASSGASATVNTLAFQSDGSVLLGGAIGSLQGASPSRPVWRLLSTVAANAVPPVITSALTASTAQNAEFTFAVTASNSPTTFTAVNLPAGLAIDAATGIISGRATTSGAINVTLTASNTAGSSIKVLVLTVVAATDPGRLVNLSILTNITTATDSFTLGVVTGGSGTSGAKALLVRAAGPSLGELGVPSTLTDPNLEFFSGSTKIGENDNWGGGTTLGNAFSAVGAFPYAAASSKDSAIYNAAAVPGGNSIKVSGVGGATGTVIAEIYDSTPSGSFSATTPRLINVSVLKEVGTGFTIGFVVGGSSSRKVLVRAVGPGLAAVGVPLTAVVADPKLTLFAGQTQIDANDNWGGTSALTVAMAEVGAFALTGTSKDASLLATLQPGSYSVQIGSTAGTGLVIAEVYEVP